MKYNVPTENNVNFEYKQETRILNTEEKISSSVKFETQLIELIQQFAFSNELKVSSIEISWARNEDHFEGSSIDRIFVDYKSTRKA